MNPPQRMWSNRPPPLQPIQATRKRKSNLENKFEKEYPYLKWCPKAISVKFLIPLDKVKEMIDDKKTLIKYIYDIKKQRECL